MRLVTVWYLVLTYEGQGGNELTIVPHQFRNRIEADDEGLRWKDTDSGCGYYLVKASIPD